MHETPGKCNSRKPHLLSKFYGTNPGAWKYDENFNNPMLNQQEGYLARTGEYEQCASGGSVFDMVGNLHEWVSDTVDGTLPSKIPLEDNIKERVPHVFGHGIFMGGFYSTGKEHGHGCGFITLGHEPTYHDYSTGFRCCKQARPSEDHPQQAKK
jgi:formylglycine-generating enzyme required for sulfatase activity